MISHYTSAIGKVQGQQTCRFSRLQVRSDFTRTPCTGCASIEAFGPRKWADSLTTYCGVRLNTLDSLKATLGSDRERLPATWTVEGRWEQSKLCGPCQIDVRIQMCRVLDCRRWKENGMRTTPTHSWFRYRPSSLTDLPPAVRDVGNDGPHFRFLVSGAGRSHAFPASRSTNGPDP